MRPTGMSDARPGIVAVLCLFATVTHGECPLPPPPSKIPQASTATEPEMIRAMLTLKAYTADVTNYAKCLEFEASQNRITHEEQARRHNEAIDRLQKIAEKFNEQVRLFKARNGQ